MSGKSLVTMLAASGLLMAGQQAGAVIVGQSDDMTPGGANLGAMEWFEDGGSYVGYGTAESDSNGFAIMTKNGTQNHYTGFSYHLDVADVTAVQTLQDGMVIRTSAWVLSDPENPWTTQATQGWKVEFYNVALGAFNSFDMTNETENGMGYGLIDATSAATTTGWTQMSATYTITDAQVDFLSLQEIRPVFFTGDWSGSDTDGRLFVDGFAVEVFPNVATANATALPSNTPGGFDLAPPVDLSGDIDGDGFVGLSDLDIVLNHWNQGTPPVAPGTDVITDFSNFTVTDSYNGWGTYTSGTEDFRIQASSWGGCYYILPEAIDATGQTALEVKLDVGAANEADQLGIVLFDADGTQMLYRLDLVEGNDQTILLDLVLPFAVNNEGTIPGLDLSTISSFHIQGTFADGEVGLPLDVTLDNLALTGGGLVLIDGDIAGADGLGPDGFVGLADLDVVLNTWNNGTPPASGAAVPEPASLALVGLGGLAMLRRRA